MFNYYNTKVQIVIISLVLFCTAGMWNALTSLGGGGSKNVLIASNANIALYTCFAVFGCLAGGIHNILGPRTCAAVGALPYGLYTLSIWYSTTHDDILAHVLSVSCGALVGIGASIMWTTQGAIMMSYPTSQHKGLYIGIFWAIFNSGPVLGSLITTIINWNNSEPKASDATYLSFVIIMFIGVGISFLLAAPNRIVRDDGTKVVFKKENNVKMEIYGLCQTFTDSNMVLLVPAFLGSNWFYPVHFNGLNLPNFSFRTRSFNSIFYWGAQIMAAMLFGKLLDLDRITRKKRALIALFILFIAVVVSWSGFFVLLDEFYKHGFSRNSPRQPAWDLIISPNDWYKAFLLFFTFGCLDAAFQSFTYWLLTCCSNDSSTLARYAGFYKGIQSIGGAIAWAADGSWGFEYMPQASMAFIVLIISLPLMYILVRRLEEPIDEELLKKQLHAPSTSTNSSNTSAV